MSVDNLNANLLRALVDRVHKLEVTAPVGYTSVTEGSLRIASAEGLIVEGSAKVTGVLNVSGTETVTGTLNVNGPMNVAGTENVTGTLNVSGPLNVTGTETVTGTLNVNGPANITGATTLTGNLAVNSPGTITVAGAIPMTIGNAQLAFSSGSSVVGYANGISVASGGTPGLVVSTGGVAITGSTSKYLTVSSGGHFVGGVATTTSAANVFIDSTSGALSRVTSAARFKIDPQPMDLPDSLLAVPVKDWIDRGAHERGEAGPRVPGIIAEEVAAAGGEAFVTYDGDGVIQGVSYDRLALARTEILARKLDAAMDLIADLQKQLAK